MKEIIQMIVVLSLISGVCALALSGFRAATAERIEDQVLQNVQGPKVKLVLDKAENDITTPETELGESESCQRVQEYRHERGAAGNDGAVVIEQVKEKKGAIGFNAQSGEVEDLVKAGILDPTKVTRIAVQNASSIAGLLLTTEAGVTEKPEKKKKGPPMPPGGGYGDMY